MYNMNLHNGVMRRVDTRPFNFRCNFLMWHHFFSFSLLCCALTFLSTVLITFITSCSEIIPTMRLHTRWELHLFCFNFETTWVPKKPTTCMVYDCNFDNVTNERVLRIAIENMSPPVDSFDRPFVLQMKLRIIAGYLVIDWIDCLTNYESFACRHDLSMWCCGMGSLNCFISLCPYIENII